MAGRGILAGALVFALAACGDTSDNPATDAGGGDSPASSEGSSDSPNGTDSGPNSCALPPSILDGFKAARTLHVAPTGNDSNDGLTTGTAWATLVHDSALKPGDEIRVAAGTYPCPVMGPLAGTAAAPIHFVADGAARSAVLDCGGAGEVFLSNLQYVAFDGFEIRNATSGHCINLISGSGPPYTNLSEHVLFVNDFIHNCNLSAFKSSQSFEIEVRNSELSNNVAAGNPLIDFAGAHHMRVIGCDVHDSVSIGVQVKGGAYNCLVEGNRIHDVADTAIQLGEATGLPYFLPGYTDWEAQDSVAANNLIYGSVHAGVAVQGCNRCIVAHNTMWGMGPAFFVRAFSTTNGTGASIDTAGLVLEDNIFAANTVPIPLNIVAPSDKGLVQGYNLYYSTGGAIAGHYSDTPIGGSGNLVDMDPKFVSATTPDLHLGVGSPAIGAATPVPQVTRDFSGACRTNKDLGAW